jgi:hypothetical protein
MPLSPSVCMSVYQYRAKWTRLMDSILGSQYRLSNTYNTCSKWTTSLLHGFVDVFCWEGVRLKSWPQTVVFWFWLVLSTFRYATPTSFLIRPLFIFTFTCYVMIHIIWGQVFQVLAATEFNKLFLDWQPREVVQINGCFRDRLPHWKGNPDDGNGTGLWNVRLHHLTRPSAREKFYLTSVAGSATLKKPAKATSVWKQSDGIGVDLVHSGCGSPGSRGSNDQLGGRAAVRMAHTSPGRGRSADRNSQLSASHCSVLYCHSCRSYFIQPFFRYTFASFFFPIIIQQILQNIFRMSNIIFTVSKICFKKWKLRVHALSVEAISDMHSNFS